MFNWKSMTLAGIAVLCLVGNVSAFWRCRQPSCCDAAPCCQPCAPCAPVKVLCCEMVPEQRQCVRTVYKMQEKVERYTAYRCVPAMEERVRNVCYKRYVTETVMQTRTCVERVPVWQERTIMKSHWETQQVTVMKTRCVDRGHWEYKEVPVKSFFRKGDCCDPCPKTKCVKCWVPCKVTECYPVTCCKKVRVCVPCTVKVCVYQKVCKTIQVPVCRTRCVTEMKAEKYQCCVNRMVPYEATRTVCCCVPVQENYTVTVCVPKWTERMIGGPAPMPAPAN